MERQEVERLVRRFLVDHFSDEELATLCADLGIDYDIISGDGKVSKARELVEYCSRRNTLMSLLELAKGARPKVSLHPRLVRLLKESISDTQEVTPGAILEKMRQTGGLNVSMRTLVEFGDRIARTDRRSDMAVIIGIISIVMSLLTMLLVALK